MSRKNNRHSTDNELNKTTAFDRREKTGRERSESEGRHSEGGRNTAEPLLVPRLLSPREQVVRILAEGIWEMVLAGKAPKRTTPGASVKHSLES